MIPLSLRRAVMLAPLVLLTACNTVVMNPSGYVASQESRLIVIATVLMLLIIVPVIALTIFFAWRYRQSNTAATYTPDWDHSTGLEVLIWGAPLLIIIALGAVTWISTHELDPYRPLTHIDTDKPIAPGVKPLIVEVVALDWKWLFIYPEQGIATVNELVVPVNVPVRFKISASNVMNSFYIPALAGQIYAMPGMQTTLNAVINQVGTYEGFSANYSGAGFSNMRFKFHGKNADGFDAWVNSVKAGGGTLDRVEYLALEKPSVKAPVRHFSIAEAGLFAAVVERCVEPGATCTSQMAMSHMSEPNGQQDMKMAMVTPSGPPERATDGAICTTPPILVKANHAK